VSGVRTDPCINCAMSLPTNLNSRGQLKIRLKRIFGSQVSQTCDFGPPSLKIALLTPQVSPPLQNPGPP